MDALKIRLAEVNEIYGLRREMLRPGQGLESVMFDGDKSEGALHVALFSEGKLAGCVSVVKKDSALFDISHQYQMRGLAVGEGFQKRGFGKALVKYSEFLLLNRGAGFVWLNARVHVRNFYEKLGYFAVGEEFDIPGVCMHIVMAKNLSDTGCEDCKKCR